MQVFSRPQARPSSVILQKIIEYRVKELEEHMPREPHVYYVTDLVRCPQKREFEIKHPKLLFARAMYGRTFLGETMHRGMEAVLKEIYGDRVSVEYEEDLEKTREIHIDNTRYVVKGRIDAVLDNNTGIEIKETISRGALPYPHHVEQCMIYNWLYGFKRTLLFYVTPDGLYEFEITDSFSDDEIIRRIKEKKTPRWSWECEICEFKPICPVAKLMQNNKQRK